MFLKLEELTVEQKIGMLLCGRRFREDDIEFMLELVKKRALGAIQPSIRNPKATELLKNAADYPLIIVNDTERGFPTSELPKIPLVALAATGKKEYFQAFAKAVVRDAKEAYCNGTWGPVIDILKQDGPISIPRKLSDDPKKVAEIAEEIARIYTQNHYFSCGKHYPGGPKKSATPGKSVDTHMSPCSIHITKEELIESNFYPYLHLWKKGLLPSIMVGHGTYPDIDPVYPASLSKKIIGIIRDMGYDGVFFTDSFAMLSILQKFGEENVYGLAIAAGNDIVLPNYNTSVKDCYEMLLKNYQDGVFTEERLNEAVRRVLALQEFVGTEPENPTTFTEEDERLLRSVAKDCITAVCDEGLTAALPETDKKRLFIVLTEVGFSEDAAEQEIPTSTWYDPQRVTQAIKENFPHDDVVYLSEFPTAPANDRVLRAATKVDEVVFVSFCDSRPYMGTDCLTRRVEAVMDALISSKKMAAVVHFGNPFALTPLKHIPRKIFGYLIPDSQRHVFEVLSGKYEAKGTLPFHIEFE